ncbi:hypothetical protein VN12_26450 [Pirellula sp. SH-Sr6A]|nr:hypothetical protein VN12_26450 [Pirellula sp. SH-Sr6A]
MFGNEGLSTMNCAGAAVGFQNASIGHASNPIFVASTNVSTFRRSFYTEISQVVFAEW